MFSFQIFVGSRRELVANSVHTADADAAQLDSRRRCVLGITLPSASASEVTSSYYYYYYYVRQHTMYMLTPVCSSVCQTGVSQTNG